MTSTSTRTEDEQRKLDRRRQYFNAGWDKSALRVALEKIGLVTESGRIVLSTRQTYGEVEK